MPELPEVETIRREMEHWLVGQKILRVEVRNKNLRLPVDKKIIELQNKQIISIQRRARYLLIELDQKSWIIIHLGMSGCLHLLLRQQLPRKHDHIDLFISNNYIIRYTDPRRFGFWLWSDNLFSNSFLADLGPEPLSDEFNSQWLYCKSLNKNKPIKPWLMDNKLVVGIGNIYANEALFIAGILPTRAAKTISKKDASLLVKSIKTLLLRSIKLGGTTMRDFLKLDGKPGYFMQELQVYGRAGKLCQKCKTLIKVIRQNQRSTFFCPKCQC